VTLYANYPRTYDSDECTIPDVPTILNTVIEQLYDLGNGQVSKIMTLRIFKRHGIFRIGRVSA
jgi:hypothetical protein